MDGQVSLYTDALGLAVWILNALDGAAALQHDGQVARGKDARADMTDGIRAVDGGVVQGQDVAVHVVAPALTACVFSGLAAFHHGGATHHQFGQLGGFRQQSRCRAGAVCQVSALRAAHRAVRINTVLGAEGLTGTFRRGLRFAAVRWVAEFAVRRVKGAGASLGIAAGFIVDVLAVQFLCDTAAFHAAHMGTGACFLHIRVRRGSGIL